MKNANPPDSIAGFVTCKYDENWWLPCVLGVCSDANQVNLTFMHSHGPSNSYKYPDPHDINTIPMESILTLVDPRTTRSCPVYSLTKKEMSCATERLQTFSPQ